VVDQSPLNKETVGDLENATGFRRVRIGATGTIGPQIYWISEMDVASGNIFLTDVFMGVQHLPFLGEFRFGRFREPFSLEAQTSSNYFTFLERSSVNTLDPARNWGLAIFRQSNDELSTFALGGFRVDSNSVGLDVSDDGDWAVTTRATRLLWYDEASGDSFSHVGAAFSHRLPEDNLVRLSEQAQVQLIATEEPAPVPFINTITLNAYYYQLYNVEWAWVRGPFSAQAEWYGSYVDQIGGGPVFLHGCYAFVSYFLTGEHRAYDKKRGAFGQTKVLSPFLRMEKDGCLFCGPGAWEIAGRFSYLDFDNRNIPPGPQGQRVGDRLCAWTLCLNWYLTDNTRVIAEYDYYVLDNPNFGHSTGSTYAARLIVFW
jgi:phosphate-selective porin OprO/OprP